jgi:hypothetical protein
MMIKNLVYIGCLFFLCNCTNKTVEQNNMKQNEILSFLNFKRYTFHTNKSEIPIIVIDSISSINKELFIIGDSLDIDKISFSDASLGTHEYKRKLKFALISDSICLIVYTEGGVGTHDVIDFMKYNRNYKHIRYMTNKISNDTVQLRNYLKGNPIPIITN